MGPESASDDAVGGEDRATAPQEGPRVARGWDLEAYEWCPLAHAWWRCPASTHYSLRPPPPVAFDPLDVAEHSLLLCYLSFALVLLMPHLSPPDTPLHSSPTLLDRLSSPVSSPRPRPAPRPSPRSPKRQVVNTITVDALLRSGGKISSIATLDPSSDSRSAKSPPSPLKLPNTLPKSSPSVHPSSRRLSPLPSPQPTHPRSKRGRRVKHLQSPNIKEASDNPKPLSIEDAISQIKINPFNGGPLKLSPSPSRQSEFKPSPSQIVLIETQHSPTSSVQLERSPSPLPTSSKPSEAHFNWADDVDDGSLPDIDDWLIPSNNAATASISETRSSMDSQSPISAIPTTPPSIVVEELVSPSEQVAVTNIASVRDDAPSPLFEGKEEQLHLPEEEVRVLLPSRSKKLPKVTPRPEESGPKESLKPALPPSPSRSEIQLPSQHRSTRQDGPGNGAPPRPASIAISPRDNTGGIDQSHLRTRSLPHTSGGGNNNHRAHSRPIISAIGLSRISRSLAPAGLTVKDRTSVTST